ncbi:MAG: sodium/proton-translocating pyrophosphatase, partial [Flavobacteriales bacterium]
MDIIAGNMIYLIPALGLLGVIIMIGKVVWVTKQETGEENMRELASHIAEGAMAFLRAEWKVLTYYSIVTGLILAWLGTQPESHSHPLMAVSFIIGAFFSCLAGYVGMNIATKANVRTAQSARGSLKHALKVSFNGGTVMGLGVASLAVIGMGVLFIIFNAMFVEDPGSTDQMRRALEVLAGFSLGSESIALFARVGGGIYTKAADVGADL